MVGVTVTTNSSSLGSREAAIENGFCRFTLLGVSPDTAHLTESVDTSRFLHKPRVLDDPQLYCTTGALPAQVIVAHVWAQGLVGSLSTGVYYTAVVDLEVIFTDPVVFT